MLTFSNLKYCVNSKSKWFHHFKIQYTNIITSFINPYLQIDKQI